MLAIFQRPYCMMSVVLQLWIVLTVLLRDTMGISYVAVQLRLVPTTIY